MNITDGEKLILLMISELYDHLGIDGEIDSDFIRSAILDDKTWSIPWKCSGIPFEEQKIPEIVAKVLDILDMWSVIENSYEKLTEKEKAHVVKETLAFGKDPRFHGFDGNSETDYMSTASFLVNELDRYEEFKGRDFNSHQPLIDSYNQMLSAFEPIRETISPNHLHMPAESIIEILKKG